MNSLDKNIRTALDEIDEEAPAYREKSCPSEEILILYTEGGLTGSEKDHVQEHLSYCPACLDVILLATATDTELLSEKLSQPVPSV